MGKSLRKERKRVSCSERYEIKQFRVDDRIECCPDDLPRSYAYRYAEGSGKVRIIEQYLHTNKGTASVFERRLCLLSCIR